MKRTQAIKLLGGTVAAAAETVQVSVQAVNKWPPVLPRRIADRVLGAYMRKAMPAVVCTLLHEAANDAHSAQAAQQGVAHG